ncbi:zinc-ribbon domain-containing protein [Streptomyces erythrochromogenes]|uniref:zinc-ribbon domain-containing protein n=1 Tax=Streptomyces erythrochromogenes TaxID=285574 RepID=UPI0036F77CFA
MRNDGLMAEAVTAGSHRVVWWQCPVCSGGFRAKVFHRVRGVAAVPPAPAGCATGRWRVRAPSSRRITIVWADSGYAGQLVAWAKKYLNLATDFTRSPTGLTDSLLFRRFSHGGHHGERHLERTESGPWAQLPMTTVFRHRTWAVCHRSWTTPTS